MAEVALAPQPVTLREATPADAEECARICFEAFAGIHDHHRFPRDFPALEAAVGLMNVFIGHPSSATAEKGEGLFAHFAAGVAAYLDRVVNWSGAWE